MLRAFEVVDHASTSVAGLAEAQPTASLLRTLTATLPAARGIAARLLHELEPSACEQNRSADVFARESERAPAVAQRKRDIERCHTELADHLRDVRRILGRSDLEYRSVSGTEVWWPRAASYSQGVGVDAGSCRAGGWGGLEYGATMTTPVPDRGRRARRAQSAGSVGEDARVRRRRALVPSGPSY